MSKRDKRGTETGNKLPYLLLFTLIGALCALALVGCGSQSNSSNSSESDGGHTVDHVVMTYVQSPLNVPSIVEKDQQSFENAFAPLGVTMEYSNLTSGADQTAALASGDIQLLNCVGGTSVIISAANGADIKILSVYARNPKAMTIYSQDGSINSPEDLRGKTIAGPKGTTLNELLAAYLNTAGMTLDDVNFISMDIPSARAALEGGSVDVALLAGPNAYNAEKEGMHKVTDGEGLVTAVSVTATTQKFYDENKDICDAFLATQRETVAYLDSNYEDAMQMTADATDLDLTAVEEMYPLYDFNPNITEEDIASLQQTEQFLLASGMIDNEVDVRSLIIEQ